jgi:leucyl aminopeptidase (aminopeptidase T)
MSRAYKITLNETATRTIVAADEIQSRLELLNILPPEATASLLKEELLKRGFHEAADGVLKRVQGAVIVSVDPCEGTVSVKVSLEHTANVESNREVAVWEDVGPNGQAAAGAAREQMKKELQSRLDRVAERRQADASAALEAALAELQPELNAIVNAVTRDALKAKAASLGTITAVTEDAAAGTLTITLEV